ncbi:DUF637 domain-containing protein, partial [Ralstonia solanacearum species complex bacterium KE056]|uniref:DUF6862 domain-containing protein n=1 Tax=Ralstonia solanacearum species complex bacterium KE056 TaxID=3119585 RepID=UPI002FC3064E
DRSLAALSGAKNVGNGLTQAAASSGTLGEQLTALTLGIGIKAGVTTAINGGSFGRALTNTAASDIGAVAANVLGTLTPGIGEVNASPNSVVGNILGHVALGCATSSMQGTGCAGGAAGGLAGSVVAPLVGMGLYAGTSGTSGTNSAIDAATVAIGAMAGGAIAHAIGGDTTAGASTAQNAAMNNWLEHRRPNPMVYSEQERRDNAAAACKNDPKQCDVANGWDAVSKQRDANLQAACANLSSDTCRSAMATAQAAGNYIVFAGGKVYAYGKEDPVARSLDPSPAAKTLDTMVGSPLAGVFGGIPYFKSNADPAAGYYFAQYGMALEGIGAGVLGLPTGPLAGPGWRAALESPNTLYVGAGAGSALPTSTNVAGPYSAVGQGGGVATTVPVGPGYTAGDVLPTTSPTPRVSNGVALDPRLPDPVAGLGYEPKVLSSSSPNIAYSQVNGYVGELNLANTVAQLPNERVVRYGDAVGTHGADIVSVNVSTGEVTLWDNKYRSGTTMLNPSPTFDPDSSALRGALRDAVTAIRGSNLPDAVKLTAVQNALRGNVTTNTVGAGAARNSTIRKLCGGLPC